MRFHRRNKVPILRIIGVMIAATATNGCMTSRMLNADALASRHLREIKQAWRAGDTVYVQYEAYHYVRGKVWGTEDKYAEVAARVCHDNERLAARFTPTEGLPSNLPAPLSIPIRHLTNAVSAEAVLDGNLTALNHLTCANHFLLVLRPQGDTNRVLSADIRMPTEQWKSAVKVAATPFTLATDILLSPVYAVYGVWWYCQWAKGADW